MLLVHHTKSTWGACRAAQSTSLLPAPSCWQGLQHTADITTLLAGPPGSGKATVVHTLAQQHSCSVVDWQPPVPVLWHEHRHNVSLLALPLFRLYWHRFGTCHCSGVPCRALKREAAAMAVNLSFLPALLEVNFKLELRRHATLLQCEAPPCCIAVCAGPAGAGAQNLV